MMKIYTPSMGYEPEVLKSIIGRLLARWRIFELPEEYWNDIIDMFIDIACQEIAIDIAEKKPTLSDFSQREQYILFSPEELAEIKTTVRNECMNWRTKCGTPNLFVDPNGAIRI